jgi:glycosyltransferase involved in cell wall biosynthesis
MRILQINTAVNSGSTGRITEDIGQLLLDNGHESFIAFGRGNRPSKSKLIKIGSLLEVYFHGLKTLLFDRHGFGSRSATKRLIDQIERIKPDIIGLHNIHGYYLNIEVLFEFLSVKKIPVVWTLHDCWAFTGHCAYYDSISCERWQTECYQCPKKNKYPSSYFLDNSKQNFIDKKRLFNLPNQINLVTPSNWLSNEVKKSFLNKHNLQVINNGINLAVFKQKDSNILREFSTRFSLNQKKIVLGVANIWDERKGLNEFVKLRDLLDKDIEIVLIGLNKKQIKKLPNGILGIQRTESIDELSNWYNIASVYVNPTFQDNFPTTNIESLACGTPVITYKTGGSPESINQDTGIVVEKGNLKGLQESIVSILSLSKENYSGACRMSAEKLYNMNDRYNDYLNLYSQLYNTNHK